VVRGGTAFCEGLTTMELRTAQRQGRLNEVVWWVQLPSTATVKQVVGLTQRKEQQTRR
jgi:hypothetical protein